MTKSDIIDNIIEDLKANLYDSQEYIFSLVRESLMTRTKQDLKNINN